MTEDDTFRVLSRLPIGEAYEIIVKKILLGFAKTEREFYDLVNFYGYTVDEYYEYDRRFGGL